MPAILPRERRPKVRLSLPPSLEPAKESESFTSTPGGGPLEGGGGLEFIRHDYCYISGHQCMCCVAHSVLEHRLGATSVATFITKRACLLRSQRSVRSFGGRRLWRGPSAAEGASSWDGYWGRVACDAEYGLPRIPIPRTWVNKGKIYFTAPSY